MRTNNAFVGKAIDRQGPKREQTLRRAGKEKFLNRRCPPESGRRDLLTGISRRMVRQRNEDKSQYRVKQREKGAKTSYACDDVMKDRQ